MRVLRAHAAFVALAVAAIACSALPTPTPTPTPTVPRAPSSSRAPSHVPSSVPTVAPTASPLAVPVPGRAVRIAGFDVATGELRFTEALIYYDEEAHRAAREDGHPGGAPNPVWIRDLATTGSLPIDPEATVFLMGWDATGDIVRKAATVELLVDLLTGATPSGWSPPLYVFILVEDGRITGIEEPGLP